MSERLSDDQVLAIQAVLDELALEPSGLMSAIDARTGECIWRRGLVEVHHRECSREGPGHRVMGARWKCARHGLFGRVLLAGGRVGILSVRSEEHAPADLRRLRAAALEVARILGDDGLPSGVAAPSPGGGPRPAIVFAELPTE